MVKTAAPLVVDLSKVTAREMNAFFKALQTYDLEAMATFFTRVVTSCPWGDPTSADTFLDLGFFDGFESVIDAVTETAKKRQKA